MKILVIDDDQGILFFISKILKGHQVKLLQDPKLAILEIQQKVVYDLIICDINFPDTTGFEFFDVLKELDNPSPLVLITASNNSNLTIKAFRKGISDYILKPFTAEELIGVVERNAISLNHDSKSDITDFKGLVGKSAKMQALYDDIKMISKGDDINVLIQGETGVGKELVARAIHSCSEGKELPFLAVNCSAILESLFESEMFGHVKGAFTDAKTDKKGIFEEACDGVVFLDEINSLPLNMQAKINRAIEYKEIRKVGSSSIERIESKVIAATNVDLAELVSKDLFRNDLFYRLNAITINIPPLRERKEDIPLLCMSFIDRAGKKEKISHNAMKALITYEWPGNVRELKHVIDRALLYSDGKIINSADLPKHVSLSAESTQANSYMASMSYAEIVDASRDLCVSQYLDLLLKKYKGNVVQASEHAGLSRQALYRILKDLSIEASSYR